jgi:CBASS immunity sensor of nucleotide second messenger signals/TIR domain-containing protein
LGFFVGDDARSSRASAVRESDLRYSAFGPVFISYRHVDGAETAVRLARALRANGVPVWIDNDDLPPGDIPNRLHEALAGGLSGGVLVATQGVADSLDIREVEAPALLALSSQASGFSLVVVNDILGGDGGVDRDAPQRLYGSTDDDWGRPQQYRSTEMGDRARLASELARQRLRSTRVGRTNQPVTLNVQTRRIGGARESSGDLVFRTVVAPGGTRVIANEAWEDMSGFLSRLAEIVVTAGGTAVEMRGGSHLSVAFAFGAALPQTSGIALTAVDQYGVTWTSVIPEPPRRWRSALDRAVVFLRRAGARRPAIFVDFGETDPVPTFARHLAASPILSGWNLTHRARLTTESGPRVTASTAARIRQIASAHRTHEVALFLRMPWGAAAMLGAGLNTLVCEIHEWDGTTSPARYIPTIVVAAGEGSPIRQIREEQPK